MPTTLEFHGRKPITFKSAEKAEANIIHQLGYAPAAAELRQELWKERREIEAIAKHHLGLGSEPSYTVLEQSTWIQGGFNICIPIEVNLGKLSKKLIFRRPMPHKLAESTYPGTVDEKLSYSDTGEMLLNTWEARREDPACRRRLFQGISRIILSLARIPQPRIGSFQFHDDCTVTLTNRPLTCTIVALENEGTQRITQKDGTYASTEPFVSDMITFHDNRLLNNPNAVYDAGDCRAQMTQRILLRALSHQYINRARRNGPFLLQLTDVNPSNIFVDKECNLTCLIDLEWICALPAEMLAVPYWLTGQGIDEIQKDHLVAFNEIRREFMDILEEEEQGLGEQNISISEAMHNTWDSKGVWFWYCISSANAMLALLEDHICPAFSAVLYSDFEEVLSKFWCKNAEGVVQQKVNDNIQYNAELRQRFGESATI
ncbi:hypothetical protein V494_02964 [Pseudogymnoascus sp. VKM F-4513 (FW-928)]|nr:hypothetical protein V494_02964 [Pseudogymnoascus sp. VKM F-4513 (FW-928)]